MPWKMAPKQISRKSSLASYDFRKSQEAMAPLVHFSSGEEEKRGGGGGGGGGGGAGYWSLVLFRQHKECQ